MTCSRTRSESPTLPTGLPPAMFQTAAKEPPCEVRANNRRKSETLAFPCHTRGRVSHPRRDSGELRDGRIRRRDGRGRIPSLPREESGGSEGKNLRPSARPSEATGGRHWNNSEATLKLLRERRGGILRLSEVLRPSHRLTQRPCVAAEKIPRLSQERL